MKMVSFNFLILGLCVIGLIVLYKIINETIIYCKHLYNIYKYRNINNSSIEI